MEAGIFHADDWGLSPAVNAGILKLADSGTLRSASILANSSFLTDGLERLLTFNEIDLYLHFNLTYGPSLAGAEKIYDTHRAWLGRSLWGTISAQRVREELMAQLQLADSLGIPIRGLNGHHHIHLLPGVAEPVLEVLRERPELQLLIVKDPAHLPSYALAVAFLWRYRSQLGAIEVLNYLRPRHLRSRDAFLRKLARARGHALLVHPATVNDFTEAGVSDPLAAERVVELNSILRMIYV